MLEQATNDPGRKKGYRSTLSLTSAIDKSEWSTPHPGPLYPQERDPVPISQGAGWAPGKFWTDAENFVLRGIRSSYHRVRSKSLYPIELSRLKNFEIYVHKNRLICLLKTSSCTSQYFFSVMTLSVCSGRWVATWWRKIPLHALLLNWMLQNVPP